MARIHDCKELDHLVSVLGVHVDFEAFGDNLRSPLKEANVSLPPGTKGLSPNRKEKARPAGGPLCVLSLTLYSLSYTAFLKSL